MGCYLHHAVPPALPASALDSQGSLKRPASQYPPTMTTAFTFITVALGGLVSLAIVPLLLMLPDAKGWLAWFTTPQERFASSRFLLSVPLSTIECVGAICFVITFGCFLTGWVNTGVVPLGTMGWTILVAKRRSPTLMYEGFAIMFKRTTDEVVEIHVSTRYKHAVKPDARLPLWQCLAMRHIAPPDMALIPLSMRQDKIAPCMAIVLSPAIQTQLVAAGVHYLIASSPLLTAQVALETLDLWNSRVNVEGSTTTTQNLPAVEYLTLRLAALFAWIPLLNKMLPMRHANRMNQILRARTKSKQRHCDGVRLKLQ